MVCKIKNVEEDSVKYRISGNLEPLSDKELPLKEGAYLNVMTVDELNRTDLSKVSHIQVFRRNLFCVRFSKAEVFDDCIIGTLRIPMKSNKTNRFLLVTYHMQKGRLIFVTEEDTLDNVISVIRQMDMIKTDTAGGFFYEFLEYSIKDDVKYLTMLEDRLVNLEDKMLSEKVKISPREQLKALQFNRRVALRMSTSYQQLMDMACDFTENENNMFSDSEVEKFANLSERFSRLYHLTEAIREYCLQLHELQLSEIEVRQNKNMTTLTVITAIFLPLTLLVGWYGMNFINMPELQFPYGYLCIFIVSVVVVIGEVIFFKKKHFFE